MSERVIKYRSLIIIVAVVITVLAGLMIPRLEINPNLDKYVPDHLENKAYLKELNSIFGSTEMILVMLHDGDLANAATLRRMNALATDPDHPRPVFCQVCRSPLQSSSCLV